MPGTVGSERWEGVASRPGDALQSCRQRLGFSQRKHFQLIGQFFQTLPAFVRPSDAVFASGNVRHSVRYGAQPGVFGAEF
jgi:hypothetical protein